MLRIIAQVYLATCRFVDWCLSDDGIPYFCVAMLMTLNYICSVNLAITRPVAEHLSVDFLLYAVITPVAYATCFVVFFATWIGIQIGLIKLRKMAEVAVGGV